MSDKIFIGIGYKARQGKNEVAYAIHNFYPEDTAVLGFADGLKVLCRCEYGMTTKDAPLLQRVGVEKRKWREDYWVNLLRYTAEELPQKYILIPDMRFLNEAEFCNVRVKVSRFDRHEKPMIATDRDPNHESETALDDYNLWDYTLYSHEGQLEDLRQTSRRIFRAIRDKHGRS